MSQFGVSSQRLWNVTFRGSESISGSSDREMRPKYGPTRSRGQSGLQLWDPIRMRREGLCGRRADSPIDGQCPFVLDQCGSRVARLKFAVFDFTDHRLDAADEMIDFELTWQEGLARDADAHNARMCE